MNEATLNKLLNLNQEFYTQFSGSFSATRSRAQPGVHRLMRQVARNASILDVGCGNGTLARFLAASRFSGSYLGLDLSQGLLENAVNLLGMPDLGQYQFRQINLSDPNWVQEIPPNRYDWLVAFAVLHHIPGEKLRQQTVAGFAKLVSPQSTVAVSVWQWQNSPRLRKRLLPWSGSGINPEELDPGDVLMDWRAGENPGIRYVHTFSAGELTALAEGAGFQVLESFLSDGKSGDLALYQVWQQQGKSLSE